MEEKIQSLKNSLTAANVPHYDVGRFYKNNQMMLEICHQVDLLSNKNPTLEAWGEMVKAAIPADMKFDGIKDKKFLILTENGYQIDPRITLSEYTAFITLP